MLYGVRGLDVNQTAKLVARVLPSVFVERENEFRGINLVAVTSEGELQISPQYGLDGAPIETGFEEYNTVVYVDGESTAARLDPLTGLRGPLERRRLERCGPFCFGLPAFAVEFHQDWTRGGTEHAVLEHHVNDISLAGVVALAEDTTRLLANGRPGILAALWNGMADCFSPVSPVDWFQDVLAACERVLAQAGVDVDLMADTYDAYRDRVLAEIDDVEPTLRVALVDSLYPNPEAVEALRLCAGTIDPDLAFRLLIGIILQTGAEISRPQYLRYLALGRELAYGEHHVSDIDFLVQRERT